MPFIGLQLLGLVIVGFYPPLVNYLPVRTYLTSETAPPPKNPRLQACLEDYLFTGYLENRSEMEAATARIASLDLSKLPPEVATRIAGTTDGVMSVFGRVEAIRAAEAAVDEASVAYRPIHSEVRTIERDIRRLERERLQIERDIRGVDDASKRASMMADIEEIKAEIRSLENEIPANWKSVNKDYKKITLALKKERQAIAVLLTRPMVTSLMRLRCLKVPMRWPGCARCCRHCLIKSAWTGMTLKLKLPSLRPQQQLQRLLAVKR